MVTKKADKLNLTDQTKTALANQPGLSVEDLASGIGVNRQFMAGFLAALEERGEVYHRQVGPARIYFLGRQASVRNNVTKYDKAPKNIGSL